MARLQRLGVEGDDLVQREIALIGEYAEEQPVGREDRGVDVFVLIFVVSDLGAVVGEAAESVLASTPPLDAKRAPSACLRPFLRRRVRQLGAPAVGG